MTPSPTETNGRKPRVCLGLPRASAWVCAGSARAAFLAQWATRGAVELAPFEGQTSALCHNFNGVWAGALTHREAMGFTHFAMLHADVQPEAAWLDKLYEVMCETGADVVSAISPIKSAEGLTSTAVASDDPWWPRRLTMHEVYDLPESFSTADVVPSFGVGPLLVNTGCWLARLDRPWCSEAHDDGTLKVTFHTKERIFRLPNGEYAAQFQPEDWLFSRYLHARGVPYVATRKVALTHLGEMEFPNNHAWGTQRTDHKFHARAARAVSAQREVDLNEYPDQVCV